MSEVRSQASGAAPDPAQVGRDALGRHAWQEAFEELSKADREGQLANSSNP